jgi:sensor c-di-GMP phosphodiesterase-like protein
LGWPRRRPPHRSEDRPCALTSRRPRSVAIPGELTALIARLTATWRDTRGGSPPAAYPELLEAIEAGRLCTVYQPIVDLVDNRIIAVEALVRLPDPPTPELDGAQQLIAVAA